MSAVEAFAAGARGGGRLFGSASLPRSSTAPPTCRFPERFRWVRSRGRPVGRGRPPTPFAMLRRWRELVRQRHRLRALASDPDLLADIGISRADALREADKPFWKT